MTPFDWLLVSAACAGVVWFLAALYDGEDWAQGVCCGLVFIFMSAAFTAFAIAIVARVGELVKP